MNFYLLLPFCCLALLSSCKEQSESVGPNNCDLHNEKHAEEDNTTVVGTISGSQTHDAAMHDAAKVNFTVMVGAAFDMDDNRIAKLEGKKLSVWDGAKQIFSRELSENESEELAGHFGDHREGKWSGYYASSPSGPGYVIEFRGEDELGIIRFGGSGGGPEGFGAVLGSLNKIIGREHFPATLKDPGSGAKWYETREEWEGTN